MSSNRTGHNSFSRSAAFLVVCIFSILLSLLSGGCASAQVETPEYLLGRQRAKESILLVPCIAEGLGLQDTCTSFNSYLQIEIPKRIEGTLIDASDIRGLKESLTFENLMENGMVNKREVSAMARTAGCQSVVTCRIIEIKEYPPFRMVVEFLWIDARDGIIISRLYNDVDLTDVDTRYRYSNYIGEDPAEKLYERIFYSKDHFQTAYLSPEQFLHFVAAYSAKVLFSDKDSSFWNFWRIF